MRQQGFSLIELLMGLTITGIVLSLVSPALAALTEANHREEAANVAGRWPAQRQERSDHA